MKRKRFISYILAVLMCLSFLGFLPNGEKTASATTEDLILNLKFDGDLKDSSGNGYNGACTYGNITYEDGIFGKSAVFNGKSYIEVKDTPALDLKDSFTISLWAYKENMKEHNVPYVYKEEDEESWASPYKVYEHWKNTPGIYMHDGGAGSELDQFYLDGGLVDIRKWFLLTVTYDGKEVRIYNDKLLTKRYSVTGVPAATIGNLYIGMHDGSVYYKGKMDDLRIYNRAISANEVGTIYEDGLYSNPKLLKQTNSLVAHYKFENNFKDSSNLANDAEKVTGEGTIKFVDAINGKGAKFTKGSYLEVKDNDSLNFDEGFSLTGWINVNKDYDNMTILNRLGASTGYSSNDMAYKVIANYDACGFHYVPFGYQSGEEFSYYYHKSSTKNKWYHIAVTFNGEEIRWYKNGVLTQKEELDGIQLSHAYGSLMIGSNGDNFFEGTLDELKLYNYKLSAAEVKADSIRKDSISISSANQTSIKSLKVKGTVTIAATRKFIESGDTKKLTSGVTFKSSNTKIFKVSTKGIITGVKKGSANLTITHGGISKTYKVTIK